MIPKRKVLGLCLIAVFAFSTTEASSASAVDTFTSTHSPETISGTSVNRGTFRVTGPEAEVVCHTGVFHGAAVANGASSATITAEYKGTFGNTDTGHCGSFSLGKAEIGMNGCDYELTGNTTGSDAATDATFSILCPKEKEITISFTELGVTLKFPPQTPTNGGVSYVNNAGSFNVIFTATGLTYTCEPVFLCGLGGIPSEANNSDYIDEAELRGAFGTISVSSS